MWGVFVCQAWQGCAFLPPTSRRPELSHVPASVQPFTSGVAVDPEGTELGAVGARTVFAPTPVPSSLGTSEPSASRRAPTAQVRERVVGILPIFGNAFYQLIVGIELFVF